MNWIKKTLWPWVKRITLWSIITVSVAGASYAWAMTQVKPEVIDNTKPEKECYRGASGECVPAILRKIAKAESGDKHMDAKGKVIQGRVNKMDIGRYQINLTHWFIACNEKGWNPYREIDNELCAIYIYETFGTDPWNSSKANWSKMVL